MKMYIFGRIKKVIYRIKNRGAKRFVEKIQESRKQIRNGNCKIIKTEHLWEKYPYN